MSFKLIVIAPPASVKNEIKIICKLFSNGLQALHVRKPLFSKTELHNYLLQIPTAFHKKITIHSHYTLLKAFNLKGVHLTERARKKKLPSSYNPKKHSLSASFHSLKDIHNSKRNYDYIFLSPIFNSISKKNYKSSFKEADLKEFLKTNKNIIALGGVTSATIKKTKKLNFKGAATLGFIWENEDPVKAYKQLASKIK